jgi:hypothetical protein
MVVVFCENGYGFVWYCSDAGNVTVCGCIIVQVCLWVDVGFVSRVVCGTDTMKVNMVVVFSL